jgi:hypothetical protein
LEAKAAYWLISISLGSFYGGNAKHFQIAGGSAAQPDCILTQFPKWNPGRGGLVSKRTIFSALIVTPVVILGLAMFLVVSSARTQNISTDYAFLVAAGFLCDSASCPATVRSANDDSYEISGAGTFNTQSKSVTAAGTYAHKSPNGTALEAGVWVASELVSFNSYGVAPGALRQRGVALGPQPIGPKGLPISSGPMPTGGLALFHIRLLPMSGPSRIAVLQVNCALGDVPRERSVEGIRLNFESNGGEFPEEVSGRVIFLAMRPEVRAPAKAAEQEATSPEASEKPQK